MCLFSTVNEALNKTFYYTPSVEVENRDESKLECSITLHAGGRLKWYRQRSDTEEVVDIMDDYWKREHGVEYMITEGSNNRDHYYMSKLSIRITKESYAGIYFCAVESGDSTELIRSCGIKLTVIGKQSAVHTCCVVMNYCLINPQVQTRNVRSPTSLDFLHSG